MLIIIVCLFIIIFFLIKNEYEYMDNINNKKLRTFINNEPLYLKIEKQNNNNNNDCLTNYIVLDKKFDNGHNFSSLTSQTGSKLLLDNKQLHLYNNNLCASPPTFGLENSQFMMNNNVDGTITLSHVNNGITRYFNKCAGNSNNIRVCLSPEPLNFTPI